ncbi:MAG: aspartate/glutamate racemase family protein [Actinobacteria bacterium]|nr:aspartate/glutamate racemase family protein [Actinomycetota bacterium]
MRKIGLLGGMSWESTAEYYRLLNEGVRDALGGLHSARIVLSSVDFAEVERMQVEGSWLEAGSLLAAEARGLEAAGADVVLLCTNTMHRVADAVASAVSIPLLHLADATADAVTTAGLSTVGLLGTAFTMEQDFYRGRLEGHGLKVLIPDTADRALVHSIIYDELCVGRVEHSSREALLAVAQRMVDRGAEGIILGCTELELLATPGSLGAVPLFPTTRLHVEAALRFALEG